MEDADVAIVRAIYARFNARDIDGVLAALSEDVAWANGMDGGYVEGHAAIRDYWTRQWAEVSPTVEPLDIRRGADGAILVQVRQTLRDLAGQKLQGPHHGLSDRMVEHIFHFRFGKVARFDIGDPA